jgi:peptide/nickel transport system substrate-binding protein
MKLSRRSFVGGALAAPLLAKPGFGQARGSVLRVIPHADLKNIDPIWTTAYISRNHGYMVYDTLFAMDKDLKPQPQMVDKWETSADGKTWTFVLRDGLSFHDGKPVTAEDCAASLIRWGKRDAMGQLMFTAVESVSGRDAKTLEIKLTRPYGLLVDSIAKISSNVPFIMPKAIAETDPFRQIESAVGSGPFIFRKEQWVPGSKVVYEKFKDYVPRKEATSGAAGGKIAKVDRVEWLYIPDPTTCMNALMSGEVDYYEQVPADLAPVLAKAPGVKIETLDPIGSQGMMRFNHLVAPTNNPLVRRAIMRAISQKDVLAAAIGNPEYYKECASIYPCGSPFETKAGTELVSPPSIAEAKKLLAEAGYTGQPIKLIANKRYNSMFETAVLTQAMLQQAGLKVDLEVLDWATQLDRYSKGNYQAMAFAYSARLDPSLSYEMFTGPKDTQPRKVWDNPDVQGKLTTSMDTLDKAKRQALFDDLHKRMLDEVPLIVLYNGLEITGHNKRLQGYRNWPLAQPRLWNVKLATR